jgi:hypothetical protein
MYLLSAIGLTPSGFNAVQYTFIHKQYTEKNTMKQNTQNATYVTIRIHSITIRIHNKTIRIHHLQN